jgi:hypothetical protein
MKTFITDEHGTVIDMKTGAPITCTDLMEGEEYEIKSMRLGVPSRPRPQVQEVRQKPHSMLIRHYPWWLIIAMIVFVAIVLLLVHRTAHARDNGQYANSALKPWFDHLTSGKGSCCSDADGSVVKDADWRSNDGHYQVFLDGNWMDVPDDAVVKGPNLYGRTMVWPVRYNGLVGYIRCFLPGSMS